MLPLTNLIKSSSKEGMKIKWAEREEESFNAIKKALTTHPVLRHPQIGKQFVIDPDSSQFILGMVLLQ
jgi:RNase H-like domain found in reverse transcriptase